MKGFELIAMLTERFRKNGTAYKPVVFRVEGENGFYEPTGEMHAVASGKKHAVVLRKTEGAL